MISILFLLNKHTDRKKNIFLSLIFSGKPSFTETQKPEKYLRPRFYSLSTLISYSMLRCFQKIMQTTKEAYVEPLSDYHEKIGIFSVS